MKTIRSNISKMIKQQKYKNELIDFIHNIKSIKKGHVLNYLLLLILVSIQTPVISFLTSVVSYGNFDQGFLFTLGINFVVMLINDLIFLSFLKKIRNDKYNGTELPQFLSKSVYQFIWCIVLALCQNFLLYWNHFLFGAVPIINAILLVIISLFFTLIQFLIVYQIYDKQSRISTSILNSIRLLKSNWLTLLILSVVFILWSCVSNMIFTYFIQTNLQPIQGITDSFHYLLFQHDYITLYKLGLIYIVHFIIAGYLEINIIIGITLLYEQKTHLLSVYG